MSDCTTSRSARLKSSWDKWIFRCANSQPRARYRFVLNPTRTRRMLMERKYRTPDKAMRGRALALLVCQKGTTADRERFIYFFAKFYVSKFRTRAGLWRSSHFDKHPIYRTFHFVRRYANGTHELRHCNSYFFFTSFFSLLVPLNHEIFQPKLGVCW